MTKYEKLKIALEKRIADFPADKKLPGEIELSKEYSVSRMTVNKVITKLAEEGLVYRRKKAGTFVSGCKQREESIYLLIPCPDFLEQSYVGGEIYWRLMNCLHTVTLGKTVPIVLVAVSPTNDENDIDEKNLEVIKPGGTVVCLSFWFRKTFPWLEKRNCNVIYVNNQIAEDILDCPEKWNYITMDARQAAADAVKNLKEYGCKKPAFISMLYHNKLTKLPHPFVDGWLRGINAFFPDLNPQKQQIEYYPEEDSDKKLKQKLNNFLDQNPCDALFISNTQMLTACWEVLKERKLSVPEDVALITYQNDNVPVDYPAVYFNFSVFQLAVEILNICNKSEPQKKFVNADFHCIEYLKKSSVFKKSESLKKAKPRNFELEKTHI